MNMYERILQIIVLVVQELNQNKSINDIKVNQLYNLGYSDVEISTAVSWVMDRLGLDRWEAPKASSFRILSPTEKLLFDDEALSELMQYLALGLITNEQLEEIIDRATYMNLSRIDRQTLTYIVYALVLNIPPNHGFGSRAILISSDTIH